ncbi:uncharacterized protein LOC143287617 [Babylonia areolata]|uniref:uncharacterized protein LOC143287617 n=1 Tax=Babylonia areolata TaxID=304850 RepID=UPI003FCF22A8
MMLRLLAFLGVVASVFAAVSVNDCPANLPRNDHLRAFGNRCYQFVLDHTREFDDAENECRHRGGHLVIIRDLATQRFLYNTLKNDLHYNDILWIGLTDQESEGHWVWVDGTAPTFTYWASDQPGHMGGLEDCGVMDVSAGGKWHDYRCSDAWIFSNQHKRFICEFHLVPHTTPVVTMPPTTQAPDTEPPTTQAPATEPPTTQAPDTEPPTTQARATEPPTTQAPATEPPTTQARATEPPTTQAPATEPPTTQAPATEPPTTQAPATEPPSTQAPATTPTPTTPLPATTAPASEPNTTPAPEQSSASVAATTGSSEGGCPPFNCNVDCGLSGYKVDDNNCLVCQCEE